MSVLVHPDISSPGDSDRLREDSTKQAKEKCRDLFQEFSEILGKRRHLLSIDTANDLEWWAEQSSSFPYPVVLEHTLTTGISNQLSTKKLAALLRGIKRDIARIKPLLRNHTIGVTWDASINNCLHRVPTDARYFCYPEYQLYAAVGELEYSTSVAESRVNNLVKAFANEILSELDEAEIPCWTFRTAKVVPRSYRQQKRGIAGNIYSGNDFIELYESKTLDRTLLGHGEISGKLPGALAAGAAVAGGVGALVWYGWHNMTEAAKGVVHKFHETYNPVYKDAKAQVSVIQSVQASQSGSEVGSDISHLSIPGSTDKGARRHINGAQGVLSNKEAGGSRVPDVGSGLSGPARGTVDRSHIPPVKDLVDHWESPRIAPDRDTAPLKMDTADSVPERIDEIESLESVSDSAKSDSYPSSGIEVSTPPLQEAESSSPQDSRPNSGAEIQGDESKGNGNVIGEDRIEAIDNLLETIREGIRHESVGAQPEHETKREDGERVAHSP
jgi:hypothetical protein